MNRNYIHSQIITRVSGISPLTLEDTVLSSQTNIIFSFWEAQIAFSLNVRLLKISPPCEAMKGKSTSLILQWKSETENHLTV